MGKGKVLADLMHFSSQNLHIHFMIETAQPAFTYSKLTVETQEQGVKYVQS